jgi:hypothetical protein
MDVRPASDRKKPEREGLPAHYRMRADAHYVDQLSARQESIAVVERPISDLLSAVAENLATIESAASALATDNSAMARRVNLDLVRSHAWRGSWLIRAQELLQNGQKTQLRNRPIGFLLDQVRANFAAECRLSGIGLKVQTNDWTAVVAVDERALTTAVAGAVLGTIALVDGAEQATITISATTAAGELRSIEISQDVAPVTSDAAARFFEPGADRIGGAATAIATDAARAGARRHGGDAACVVNERGGSVIRLSFKT